MKVAYVLNMPNAANYKVGQMILPQLEEDRHGVEVVGIFFFDDNCLMLQKGNPKGERLAKIAGEKIFYSWCVISVQSKEVLRQVKQAMLKLLEW